MAGEGGGPPTRTETPLDPGTVSMERATLCPWHAWHGPANGICIRAHMSAQISEWAVAMYGAPRSEDDDDEANAMGPGSKRAVEEASRRVDDRAQKRAGQG